jgi:hypothetical protein
MLVVRNDALGDIHAMFHGKMDAPQPCQCVSGEV